MAVRGRKPKPSHLRLVTGNAGKRPIKANEPQPETAAPLPPSHLNEGARAEWTRIVGQLLALKLVTELDRAALAAYCVAYSRWAEAEEHIARLGAIVKAPKTGVPMQNPFLSVANNAMAQMERFGSKFGLSPQDRVRLATEGSTQNNGDAAAKYF